MTEFCHPRAQHELDFKSSGSARLRLQIFGLVPPLLADDNGANEECIECDAAAAEAASADFPAETKKA